MFSLCDDYFRWVLTAQTIAIARNDRSVGTSLESINVNRASARCVWGGVGGLKVFEYCCEGSELHSYIQGEV